MGRFARVEVINSIYDLGLVPVFYHKDPEVAKKIVNACADGGARVVEFTNRGERAYQVFSELVGYFEQKRPQVILGVGSVSDHSTASLYINAGANFVVGPTLNEEVARACNRRKIAYSPGCGSASEISAAEALGVEIVKIFPGGQVEGPSFVKVILESMPWTRIMPTGGVELTRESIRDWIQAGAACLGMGSKLISKDLVTSEDWSDLTKKVEWCLGLIRETRGEPLFSELEHIGIYPGKEESPQELANWYAETFGLELIDENTAILARFSRHGWVEILKGPETEKAHIAIKTYNFELACETLMARGLELEEPRVLGNTKLVNLRQTDPAGYKVQVISRIES